MKIKEKIEKYLFKKYYRFPCKNCLVGPTCFENPCNQLEFDNSRLLEIATKLGCCPDCSSTQFYEGPCGGASQNIQCAKCGHWFNTFIPMVFERIRIPTHLQKVANG